MSIADLGRSANNVVRWHFAGYVLDETTQTLARGEQILQMERKPLDVLRFLLRNAGDAIPREEIYQAVWPGRVLSETVLAKAVGRIREVLAQDAPEIIKTVHGYGYRLVVEVRVEYSTALETTQISELKAGMTPPQRDGWVLQRMLGSGAYGYAWLAERAGLQRVYKFARGEAGLASIRREFSLYRILKSALSDHAPVVEILAANFEVAPFYLELSYYSLGSLETVALSAGGLKNIPFEIRLEWVASAAEAVAACHRVGVLHKDLKPSNLFLEQNNSNSLPTVHLADFGSGGLLESEVLQKINTSLFVPLSAESMNHPGSTFLYLAPEVAIGEPFTTRSDCYALGVLLYQVCTGDFRRPMNAAWASEVDDPLLRADIEYFACGDPAQRPSDPDVLAQRLRGLPHRRAQQEEDRRKEQVRIEAQKMLVRLQQRRSWWMVTAAALSVGVLISAVGFYRAYEAQNRAEAAAATALESGRFMFEGLLGAFNNQAGLTPRNLQVSDLLESAGKAADVRLKNQPEIAFHVRTALSGAYNQVEGGQMEALRQELMAHAALRELVATDPERAVMVIPPAGLWVVAASDLSLFADLLRESRQRLGVEHPSALGLLGSLSDAEYRYGSLQKARSYAQEAEELARILDDSANSEDNTAFRIRLALEDADFDAANTLFPILERTIENRSTPQPLSRAYLLAAHGMAAILQGDLHGARRSMPAGFTALAQIQPNSGWYYRFSLAYLAVTRAYDPDPGEALRMSQEWLRIFDRMFLGKVDMSVESYHVAQTLWRLGQITEAQKLYQLLDRSQDRGRGRTYANWARLDLAAIATEQNNLPTARKWMAAVVPGDWWDYRPNHPFNGTIAEVQARIALKEGKPVQAEALLRQADAIYAMSYQPQHWRRRKIQDLLAGF